MFLFINEVILKKLCDQYENAQRKLSYQVLLGCVRITVNLVTIHQNIATYRSYTNWGSIVVSEAVDDGLLGDEVFEVEWLEIGCIFFFASGELALGFVEHA